MGVHCQILLAKSKEGVHKAGQVVSGAVKYAVEKPTEYKSITLSLLGTGKCVWTQNSGKSSSTYYGNEEYVTNHIHILNQETLVDIGSYEYPFEFHLPVDLPSSFKNAICTIKYIIQLEFEKTNFFSFNKKFTAEIPVYGFIKPSMEGPLIFGLHKTPFTLFSVDKPMIKLKAELEKTFLSPGENAKVSLAVANNTDIVPTIRTELFCHTLYTADCGRKKLDVEKVKDCVAESHDIPEQGVVTLSLTLPTGPQLYTINSIVMKKEYRVRVTVRLPLPYFNAYVEAGLEIGEKVGNENPNYEMEPEPPSYWEAMGEAKHK